MKKIFISMITLGLLIGSCKKLDLAPKDTISDATFWKTADDYKLAATNLYFSLEGFNFNDVESDILYNTGNDISRGTYQPSERNDTWTNAYIYIRRANTIINKGEGESDAGIKRFVAEAKFFRAYNYFQLFRYFGEVPIITEALDPDNEKLYTGRGSRKVAVDFMLKDLDAAAVVLPLRKDVKGVDVGRITKGAAQALLARIALFEGTWAKFRNDGSANALLNKAIEAAEAVIASGSYALYTAKGAQSYRYLFIEDGDDSPESVLDRRYQLDIAPQGFPYAVNQNPALPTKKLADMYLSSDGLPVTKSPLFMGYSTIISEYQNRDPRMTMTMIIPGTKTVRPYYPNPVENWPNEPQRNGATGYIVYKYLSENAFGNQSGNITNSFSYDFHILRYAEILLILAEAIYEKNGAISDADLDRTINNLRERAGLAVKLSNAFVAANSLNIREEIRRERTVELALEGFRYDDLRRWKTAEVEMLQDIKGIKIKDSEWQTKAPYSDASYQNRKDANGFLIVESGSNRFFDPSKHYLRPLPTLEITLYPQNVLNQNPNW